MEIFRYNIFHYNIISTDKKASAMKVFRRSFLTVSVKHHSGVGAGGVGTHKVVSRIFVSHDGFFYIIHRIQRYLIALPKQRTGEIF